MAADSLVIGTFPNPLTSPAWPHIEKLLAPAAERGRVPVLEPGEIVWIVWNGREIIAAATTRMVVDGTAEIILCGGRGARDWAQPLADLIAAWARDEGAALIRITGRRGWSRLIDWQMTEERDGFARYEKVLA